MCNLSHEFAHNIRKRLLLPVTNSGLPKKKCRIRNKPRAMQPKNSLLDGCVLTKPVIHICPALRVVPFLIVALLGFAFSFSSFSNSSSIS